MSEDSDTLPFVVGIGASAGGLGAAERFFRGLPAETGMTFVVVQHLAPDHTSEMAELLQNHTPLEVTQASDGEPVRPDRVYCIPPGRSLTLKDGHLHLEAGGGPRGHVRTPIDTFFRSLAAELGENAACVILSGTGTDGTLGLKAVKEAGGLVLAQDPTDAEYDGMPRSAVGTGLVDIVAPAGQLAERLLSVFESAAAITIPETPEELPDDGSAALGRIFARLRERTGHDFSKYKRTSVLRRIGRRMQVVGTQDLPAYRTYLAQNPEEADSLFRDLLISVTSFFRDPEAWEALERRVGELFEGRSTKDSVRVWVPGCATGEEAYSIAILLCEEASRQESRPSIQVFASDIDEDALVFAREGYYPEAVATDMSEERLERFFVREAGGYRVKKSIREIVLFASHNILSDPPFSKLDLVSCRNLLIYLDREMQESIFELFHYALRPGGYLFLGTAESAEGADKLFGSVEGRQRLYQRRATPGVPPRLPRLVASEDGTPPQERKPGRGAEQTVAEMHRDHLLAERVPPTVLVDSDYDVCHVVGGAGRFLRDIDGPPTRNLLDKVLPELRLDLRAALFQAFHKGEPSRTRSVALPEDETRGVTLEVAPLPEDDVRGRYAEVVFRVSDESDVPPGRTEATDDDVTAYLEEELDRTRERLQTIIEEYETSNEELKASNEELQSMNEELRSTTEELETGREELQSMNEELVTVNQELRTKIEELGWANADLQNLMAATDIGTIFLDRQLRITRYTPRIQDVYPLQPSDIGRPLGAFTSSLGPVDVVAMAKRVLDELVVLDEEMKTDDDRWYVARLRPYRTQEDLIAGVVLTFFDVTDLKRAERRNRLKADIIAHINDAVFAVDTDGRVVFINAAAAEAYGLDPEGCLGEPFRDLIEVEYPPKTSEEDARRELEETGGWRGEVVHHTPGGGRRQVEVAVSKLFDSEGRRIGNLGVIRDITVRKEAEARARERQQYLRVALRNVPLVAAICDTDLRYRWIHNPHPDFDPETILGKRDDEIVPSDEAEPIMQLKREALHLRESIRRQLSFHRSDGLHVYDMTVDPLFDDDGNLVGLTTAGLDVTERVIFEQRLQEAKAEAEHANAAKSAFLASLSHELRTPLNAITGYADLMDMGVPEPLTEGQRTHVDRIRVSARHQLQIIEELLSYARLDAGKEHAHVEDVAVGDLVEEVRAIIEPLAAQKDLDFTVSLKDAPDTIHTDPRKVRQILLNLLGNAVKFTTRGRVELRIEGHGDDVRFRVADTGPGMAEDEIETAFEPFWQADTELTSSTGGSGLGLPISRRFVQLLGGRIDVVSERGSGSVFTVQIPAAVPAGSLEETVAE